MYAIALHRGLELKIETVEIIVELGTHWAANGATRATGYAFVDGRLLRAEDIAAFLDVAETDVSWRAKVSSLNGNFAAVNRRGDTLWAAVDHIRSIPIFYGLRASVLILSDRAEPVRAQMGDQAQCPQASAEFLQTGYVTGSETLFPNVKQIQAGEALSFVASPTPTLDRCRYFNWRHQEPWSESSDSLMGRLHEVHQRVAQRLVASLNGQQAVLPLSGGYDSRLIAVMLKEQKYDNVLCYTYGLPGNWEARISESLARHLGFRWKFVPYSGTQWREWGASAEFKRYCKYASNLTAIPHVQDWPAIFELRRQGAILDNAVVVPGHSGDFLAGSHIPHWFEQQTSISRTQLLKTLLDAHYALWDRPDSGDDLTSEFTRRIDAIGGPIRDGSPVDAADQLEHWDMNERQAKFICNSVRVYDFFGLAWRLPLFDRELLNFWSRIPLHMRVGRRLYFEYVDRYQNLPVSTPNQDRGRLAGTLIDLMNRLGMRDLGKALQYRLRRRNWESIYECCSDPPLAWFTLIDRDLFKRTYSGRQTLHAYLAKLGAEGAFR